MRPLRPHPRAHAAAALALASLGTLGRFVENNNSQTPGDNLALLTAASLREGADGSIDVTIIRAGRSLNDNFYPASVLAAAAPLFEGARVFVKSDETHSRGGGKDVRNLLGGIYGVRWVPGASADEGALVGNFKPIDPNDAVVGKVREAIRRGLAGLMGLSIDAVGRTLRETRGGRQVRVCQQFVKVRSVDLIVEPGAGGSLDRLNEAAADNASDTYTDTDRNTSKETETMFKKRLLEALAVIDAARAAGLNADTATHGQLLTALQEACATAKVDLAKVVQLVEAAADDAAAKAGVAQLLEASKADAGKPGDKPAAKPGDKPGAGSQDLREGADRPVTAADLAMFTVRQRAARLVADSRLPAAVQERLTAQLETRERFTEADVQALIEDERKYVARLTESGAVRMGGDGADIRVGDRSLTVREMWDAFFDPGHRDHRHVGSLKECYVQTTGDRHVTGRLSDCDMPRLRESLGQAIDFREAITSSTFSNVLGDSITRRMLAFYGQLTDLQAWRQVCRVERVSDFRTQERTQMGGYGNLPAVAQAAAYQPLTSPGDLKSTYAVTKRGGLETLTLETIKNDDSGVARRIPQELALAAANTLYEFVFDFFRTNPTIYDGAALYTSPKGNLFTAAFSGAQFQAHRLAMQKMVRPGSNKRRGVTPRILMGPVDLQEAFFDAFRRDQNNDPAFVQTVQPRVIVVDYWSDANDWCTLADPMALPVLEIGFLDGREEPELFVQDMPNVGSLFSNDIITWKIRHIYSGTVLPEGEKGTTKAVVA